MISLQGGAERLVIIGHGLEFRGHRAGQGYFQR